MTQQRTINFDNYVKSKDYLFSSGEEYRGTVVAKNGEFDRKFEISNHL